MKQFRVTNTHNGNNCLASGNSLLDARLNFFKSRYFQEGEDESYFKFELLHDDEDSYKIKEHLNKIDEKLNNKDFDSEIRLLIFKSLDFSNLPIEQIKEKIEQILTYIKTGK